MIYVSEKQINSIQLGQTFKVEIPAIPGQTFSGKVTNISGAMDATAKAFPVKITVENPKHLIKAGMFAKVYL
jgi:cobalt-zinc-cadmium efflux system membrane fusion protein